jgi:hypothetical protein
MRTKAFPAAAAVCFLLTAGCGHWRDEGMFDAGQGLVPPDSSVLWAYDNEGAYAPLSGDYQVEVIFDDGGLTLDGVLQAIEQRASEEGWVERYRCDRPGAILNGYSRDNLKLDVRLPKPMVDDDNSIRVQRIGEGNLWPPDC